jgi:electron transfer flavoprotein beta subunit
MDDLRIVACIKQVPETTDVRVNPETNTLVREGVPSMVNPYDLYAVEESIRIKEKHGGRVTAVSMGPPQAESVLREAISMGADDGVLLTDKVFAGADTWATALTLAAAIEAVGFDLILCGKQAVDGDTAQVGPELAEMLGVPALTFVSKIEAIEDGNLVVRRMMEEGYRRIEATLPCVLTVVKGINEPRIPSLRGKLKAKSTELSILDSAALKLEPSRVGLEGSPTRVIRVFTPSRKRSATMLTGDTSDSVSELVSALKTKGVV